VPFFLDMAGRVREIESRRSLRPVLKRVVGKQVHLRSFLGLIRGRIPEHRTTPRTACTAIPLRGVVLSHFGNGNLIPHAIMLDVYAARPL
jgi:hypothetical protein